MPVSYDFSGRTAVVTGGAKGIGRAVAERLVRSGAHVWVWDVQVADLNRMTHQLADVSRADQIAQALGEILDQTGTGRIDIVVNNAGYVGSSVPLERFDPSEWRRIIEVNLNGVFEVCRHVVPHMRRAGWGRIVNMASLAGKEGTPMLSAYSSAKAGVIALTKCLGKELADTEIRVNCLAPAAIETDILKQIAPQAVEAMIAKSPLKRLGTVDEVAELVLWLCSEACSFNTGGVFDLSGGRAVY